MITGIEKKIQFHCDNTECFEKGAGGWIFESIANYQLTPKHPPKHPECETDEYFIGNIDSLEIFESMSLKTKRLGFVAYDINGVDISNMGYRPVFAKKSEIDAITISFKDGS